MFRYLPAMGAIVLASLSLTVTAKDWQSLPTKAPEPADNPTTPAKVELGRMLYHDTRLSANGVLSCNSCHNVMSGGDDNRGGSVGIRNQIGGRSAPTVWNSAFNSVQFWDGRAPSLEAQAKGPVTNPIEMGMKSWDDVVARLKSIPGYQKAFAAAFGSADAISADTAAKAIAAYERTLITPNSAYDRYADGEPSALTAQQLKGLQAFSEIGCVNCHSGAAFNGPTLPEGNGFFQKFPTFDDEALEAKYQFKADIGRAEVTKNDADKHLFKVPTLRNIALTAPYFHNGKVATLEEAVKVMAKTQLNKDLTPEQASDIVAFLNSLTGTFPKQEMPRLPELANQAFPNE